MKDRSGTHGSALLCVCYLSQLIIGTAQPFGLPAGLLIPLFAAATLLQQLLYRLLSHRHFRDGGVYLWLLAALLCFVAGYDFVRAERFYRAVTSENFSFWWLMACMLLIGWYAAHCGRPALQRAALPVLAALLLSLAVLAFTGDYRLEALSFVRPTAEQLPQMGRVFWEYTFGGELLLWLYWNAHPASTAAGEALPHFRWSGVLWLRFGVAAAFALLGELALGDRFAGTTQLFGTLSLVSAGADAGHGGALYHCIWLTALTLRVCAVCCTLRELGVLLLPSRRAGQRLAAEGIALAAAAILWAALWHRNCLLWLAVGVSVLTAAAWPFTKRARPLRRPDRG